MRQSALLILAFTYQVLACGTPAKIQALRPFTVAEEIGLTDFPEVGSVEYPVIVSPNGHFVAVWSERGLLKEGRVEDDLRVYDVATLMRFTGNSRSARPPQPVFDLRQATFKEGPIISQIRWLPNSMGLAFLLRSAHDKDELMLIGLKQTQPRMLSLKGQDVTAFAVRDASHYVYAVISVGKVLPIPWRSGKVAWDGTGQSLEDVLLRKDLKRRMIEMGISYGGQLRSVLWAAIADRPHLVLGKNGQPIVIYPAQGGTLALSPDGHTLAAALPVRNIPARWVRQFRPPFASDPYDMLRAGPQNLDLAVLGDMFVATEYALIDLRSGTIASVDREPTGTALGWWTLSEPAWSNDGQALLLPDIYPHTLHGDGTVASPCVAIFYPVNDKLRCLKSLRPQAGPRGNGGAGRPEFFIITSASFTGHQSDRVVMQYYGLTSTLGYVGGAREVFVRGGSDEWLSAGTRDALLGQQTFRSEQISLDVHIAQGLNAPPVLVARDRRTGASRTIWDPNPQLKRIRLGEATVYHWKDSSGRPWNAGLYWPAHYMTGVRYPLVIQTHGFQENYFRPSGWAPTAFAARALATRGILVLQVQDCLHIQDPEFGPCEVAMYESAVRSLAMRGLVDPNRVGIIGFSNTVFPVLDALTSSRIWFTAASITDGPTWGYWEYLSQVGSDGNEYSRVANATIGAKPFGAGLRLWEERAPDFSMQKVRTPLLINSLGRTSLFEGMWEPYAALRYLHKPVDLVLLRSDEHVLTSPAVRLASQGGSVDWFRFWLQGYESPHPVLAGEYLRWQRLCDLQRQENPGHSTWCVPTGRHLTQPGKADSDGS